MNRRRRVRASRLTGIEVPKELVPNAIDEFPAIFVVAACAEGETVLRGQKNGEEINDRRPWRRVYRHWAPWWNRPWMVCACREGCSTVGPCRVLATIVP